LSGRRDPQHSQETRVHSLPILLLHPADPTLGIDQLPPKKMMMTITMAAQEKSGPLMSSAVPPSAYSPNDSATVPPHDDIIIISLSILDRNCHSTMMRLATSLLSSHTCKFSLLVTNCVTRQCYKNFAAQQNLRPFSHELWQIGANCSKLRQIVAN
jgi:hypothetical protein